jgi:biopolymer transport protein TolR
MLIKSVKTRRNRPMAEINVVPYIDVMLVLLVIFMITAPLLTQGVKVDLPKAEAKAISSKSKEPIIVSVDASGNYFLNIAADVNRPIAADALMNRVSAELELDKKNNLAEPRLVLVKGDQRVDYGKVVQVMALLQRAGAEKVGLVTDIDKTSK